MTRAAPILLMTRPHRDSRRFAAACRVRLGRTQTVIAPVFEIVPRPLTHPLADVAGLIFTSAHGVRAFAAQSARRDLPAWCVGARTARAARAAGLTVQACGGDAAALAQMIQAQPPCGRLLHLRGVHATGDLAARLTAAGRSAEAAVIYDQPARALSPAALAALGGLRPVIAPLFSPRSARLLSDAAEEAVAPLHLAAISPAAAAAWQARHSGPVEIARQPDGAAMLNAVAALHARITVS